jgi:hypothetical protein
MKKYISGILGLATAGLLLYTIRDQHQQIQQLKQQVTVIDSLRDELFNEKADNGRYELTVDEFLKSKYPKVGKEFDEYFNHETE